VAVLEQKKSGGATAQNRHCQHGAVDD